MQSKRKVRIGLLALFAAVVAAASPAAAQQTHAQSPNPADFNRETLEQRAVSAAIWGMPIVSVYAMRQAYFRDAKANYNDIVFWSKFSDWKNQTTTPNSSTHYVYFNFNTKDGPVVLEIPPTVEAGLFGSLLDAWQVPLVDVGPRGEDQGKGGKYLLLPPDFKGDPPTGYIIVRSQTYNGYALLRAIPKSSSKADVNNAIGLVKKKCDSIRWPTRIIRLSNVSWTWQASSSTASSVSTRVSTQALPR